MQRNRILVGFLAIWLSGAVAVGAQEGGVEAPADYQQEVDTLADPTGGPAYEADAAAAQAEAVERSGSAEGLSKRGANRVEEIVVSARKRAELLEDTPISVTALSESALRESGITRIDGIQELVPNMTYQPGFIGGQSPQIRIRGVGTSATGPAFDPGVGLYLDGVFLPRASGAVLDVVDVQQIEVLRGPQGTLFGKNTVGGAVNITTVKPSMDPEGFVMLRPGNFGTLTTRAMVNLPVGAGWLEDKLAVRLSFGSGQSSGYIYNAFRDEYVSDNTSLTFIGAVRFLPVADLTIDVSGSYAKVTNQGRGGQCVFMREGSITSLAPGYEEACNETRPFESGANLDQLGNFANYGTWGVIRYDVGDLSVLEDVAVKSVTSWRQQRNRARTDLDGTRIDVVDLNAAGGDPSGTDGTPGRAEQIQQELQFNASSWDGRINFVSGFFSFWETAEAGNTVFVPVIPQANNSNIKTDNFTWALYGQGTADVTEWLSLTAGLRYTSDRKGIDQFNHSTIIPDAPTGGGTGEKTFTSWTPTASVALLMPEEWMGDAPIDHVMGYFTYSRGFKGGGFNAAVQASADATEPDPYDPETLDNFEVGLKMIGLDQTLTMNVAAFYAKYDDIQVTAQRSFTDDEGNPIVQRLTLNAATATTKGVEVEMLSRPVQGLALSGTLGYLDATYGDFPGALSDFDGTVIDRSGQSFNLAPKLQTFLSAQYSFPVALGEGAGPWLVGWVTPRVEWAYRDRSHVLGPEAVPGIQRGYNLLNARLSYDFLDDRAQVALWAKNLLDESYFQDAFAVGGTFGSLQRWYRAPRTYGGELSYRF